jgi:hypothetical protein
VAVVVNRLPWLPGRLFDRDLPAGSVRHALAQASRTAERFEHLVKPRLLALTASGPMNAVHGIAMVTGVLTLMAPLPLVPFANTLPAVGVIMLALGMAERDGLVIMLGHTLTLMAVAYVGTLIYLAVKASIDPLAAWESLRSLAERHFGR